MRLLRTRDLQLEEFFSPSIPRYAILSHTWGDGEVSFQDVNMPSKKRTAGQAKIEACASKASQHGFEYFWVDTCCIDRTSSAELTEAINSMFSWYREAAVCYAYLSDVFTEDGIDIENRSIGTFAESKWFTRGWTLQELLAPTNVLFYDANWAEIGSKAELCEEVNVITGIPSQALTGATRLGAFSIAERMSWASERSTTRKEDMAYCLLGIFDVNMHMLYGEGYNAFSRLQEEIMKTSMDQSIFAWADPKASIYVRSGLLASSPAHFAASRALQPSLPSHAEPFAMTNKGLRIRVPIAPIDNDKELLQAFFHCEGPSGKQSTFAIYLITLDDSESLDSCKGCSAESRRFARVCTNFIDCSFNRDPVDLQTVYVPMAVDTLDHFRMSDAVVQPDNPIKKDEWSKKQAPWMSVSAKDVENINIHQSPERLTRHTRAFPLVSSRSGDRDALHLRMTVGTYQCTFTPCFASFIRRSDLKLHEEFTHVRQDILVPCEDGGLHYLEDSAINSNEARESPRIVEECEHPEYVSTTQSGGSSGLRIFSQKSRSHVTNGTITPASTCSDNIASPSSESNDESDSILSSVSEEKRGPISSLRSSSHNVSLYAQMIRTAQRAVTDGPATLNFTKMVADLFLSTNWSDTWRQTAGEGTGNGTEGRSLNGPISDQRHGLAQKRPRPRDNDGSGNENDDQHSRKRQQQRSDGGGDGESDPRKLACPYFKHDPTSHASRGACCGPGWPDVHRVKEHLYRCHTRPITCLRCNRPFRTEQALLDHQQEDTACLRGEVSIPEGFSKEQEHKLRKRFSSRSEKEKWRKVYNILFPEVPVLQIPSPYYELEDSNRTLDHLQPGLPNILNVFLEALWQDPIIRTRARELLISNVAGQAGIQDLLQSQYPGSEQRQRAEQSHQPPVGDAAHSDLAANFRPPNSSGSSLTHFIQNETSFQNNDIAESHGFQRLVPTLTEPPSQSGQILEGVSTPEWTTSGFSGAPPIDDDLIQEFLRNAS